MVPISPLCGNSLLNHGFVQAVFLQKTAISSHPPQAREQRLPKAALLCWLLRQRGDSLVAHHLALENDVVCLTTKKAF